MVVRRFKQFFREPRMWFLLASPFITAIFSFCIVGGVANFDKDDEEMQKIMILVNGIMFSIWMLIGFCTCSGIFILSPISDREFKLRYLMNYIGMQPLAYYIGNFISDYTLFMIPTLGFIILLFPM
jgi:hypothetical protein